MNAACLNTDPDGSLETRTCETTGCEVRYEARVHGVVRNDSLAKVQQKKIGDGMYY